MDSAKNPQVHVHELRVYWEDTDAGGIVYYANYLKFFERARTEWLRSLGLDQRRLQQEQGLLFVVAAAGLRYHAPARLDDVLRVTVQLRQVGRASLALAQTASRADTRVADAEVRIGCVDAGTFRAHRIPNLILERIG